MTHEPDLFEVIDLVMAQRQNHAMGKDLYTAKDKVLDAFTILSKKDPEASMSRLEVEAVLAGTGRTVSRQMVVKSIRELMRAGKLEFVGKMPVDSPAKPRHPTPFYRLAVNDD